MSIDFLIMMRYQFPLSRLFLNTLEQIKNKMHYFFFVLHSAFVSLNITIRLSVTNFKSLKLITQKNKIFEIQHHAQKIICDISTLLPTLSVMLSTRPNLYTSYKYTISSMPLIRHITEKTTENKDKIVKSILIDFFIKVPPCFYITTKKYIVN